MIYENKHDNNMPLDEMQSQFPVVAFNSRTKVDYIYAEIQPDKQFTRVKTKFMKYGFFLVPTENVIWTKIDKDGRIV